MPEPLAITVTSGSERLSRREQIAEVLVRAVEKREPIRVRLPFTLYDHADSRSYVFLRDATWNLQLPVQQTTPEMIEDLIHAIGQCIVAIAQHGSAEVEDALRGMGMGDEE